MKTWTLDTILSYFDHFVKDVDFAHLPALESEEYRQRPYGGVQNGPGK